MGENQRPRALVVYDTRYGNTGKIAAALAKGIETHCDVDCVNVRDADPASVPRYNLIAVGAPTEAWSARKEMKEFLSKLEGVQGLRGKLGFAFDTRVDSRLSGSAAKLGLKMVLPTRSGFVTGSKENTVLKEGEETRFESIGDEIGLFVSRY
jgi:flavorubredoxin